MWTKESYPGEILSALDSGKARNGSLGFRGWF